MTPDKSDPKNKASLSGDFKMISPLLHQIFVRIPTYHDGCWEWEAEIEKESYGPCLLIMTCTPNTALCTLTPKMFQNFPTLTCVSGFYLSYSPNIFEAAPEIEVFGHRRWPFAGSSEGGRGASKSWHYGKKVCGCAGWDGGGQGNWYARYMQGHPELRLPLHSFHFVLSAYYLDENPFLLFHLSSHFDQCRAS